MNIGLDRALRERSALERLARWQRRPEVKRVATSYADWVNSPDGILIMTQLSALAMLLLARKVSRANYNGEIRRVGKAARLPSKHWRIIVRGSEEMVRCMLVGSGQLVPTEGGE